MALAHQIPELDRKGLREFGLVTGSVVAGLFGVLLPWLFELGFPLWPWAVLGVLAIWALLAPQSLRPIYRGWMRFGLLASGITTPIILGAVFYLTVVPMAVVMRLVRYDPMARRFDNTSSSYRVASQAAPKDNLEKPF